MENKRINILFSLVVLFFLALTYILVRDLNANRIRDYQRFTNTISSIVRQKNEKIRELSNLLIAKQNENAMLNNTLAETKNALDSLTRKLSQPPTPIAAPVPMPASAPVAATK